jgi:hypothetical protein
MSPFRTPTKSEAETVKIGLCIDFKTINRLRSGGSMDDVPTARETEFQKMLIFCTSSARKFNDLPKKPCTCIQFK